MSDDQPSMWNQWDTFRGCVERTSTPALVDVAQLLRPLVDDESVSEEAGWFIGTFLCALGLTRLQRQREMEQAVNDATAGVAAHDDDGSVGMID